VAAPIVARAATMVVTNPRLRRWALAIILGIFLLPLLVLVGVLSFYAEADCGNQDAAGDFSGSFDGPGSLGGVMGTGVSRAELLMARRHPLGGTTVVPHEYVSTAYAPAAGGINCGSDCRSTASGIVVNGGRKKRYIVASNPAMNKYGAMAYIWPNPYGWRGPFVIADTGGNFDGSDGQYRVDFYVWGDQSEARSNSWGRRSTRLSTQPIVPGGPTGDLDTTVGTGGDEDTDACPAGDGGSWDTTGGGKLVIAPGANRPGVSINPTYISFAKKVADLVGPRPLVITTDTNHSQMTTSGNVSDHWTGWAGDYGMAANGFSYGCVNCRGQKIAAAAMVAAGLDKQTALHRANQGGLFNLCSKGYRVQVIYRTNIGGDHFNHVHIGLRKGC